jgi:hypothetical protein
MERAAGRLGNPSPFRCELAGEDAKCFFLTPTAYRSTAIPSWPLRSGVQNAADGDQWDVL